MNSRERVLCALNLQQPDMVPFFDNVDIEMQRMILGREDFDQLDFVQEMHFDALAYAGFTPPSFVRTECAKGSSRKIQVEGLIKTRDDLKRVQLPVVDDAFMEGARNFIEKYRDTGKALYFRTRTGSANVLQSMGLDGFSYALYDDPGLIDALFGMYTDWIIQVLDKAQSLGFDFAWFADDIAYKNGPMFSPGVFRKQFLPHIRSVVEHIKLPWVYHSDGNLMALMDDLLSLGMNGLNPIEPEAMDIEEMKWLYGDRICLMGNIDLHYTLTLGTVEEVEREVERKIRTIGKGGGYIIASGNSIPDYCKVENVLAMRDAVVKYRNY